MSPSVWSLINKTIYQLHQVLHGGHYLGFALTSSGHFYPFCASLPGFDVSAPVAQAWAFRSRLARRVFRELELPAVPFCPSPRWPFTEWLWKAGSRFQIGSRWFWGGASFPEFLHGLGFLPHSQPASAIPLAVSPGSTSTTRHLHGPLYLSICFWAIQWNIWMVY